MNTDPLIAAIREARHRISAEVGHDPKRLVAYYRERERKLQKQGARFYVLEESADAGRLQFNDKAGH